VQALKGGARLNSIARCGEGMHNCRYPNDPATRLSAKRQEAVWIKLDRNKGLQDRVTEEWPLESGSGASYSQCVTGVHPQQPAD